MTRLERDVRIATFAAAFAQGTTSEIIAGHVTDGDRARYATIQAWRAVRALGGIADGAFSELTKEEP